MLRWRSRFLGEYIGVFLHATPVFNSFSVVVCIPSYRRIVGGWLCGMFARVEDESSGSGPAENNTVGTTRTHTAT